MKKLVKIATVEDSPIVTNLLKVMLAEIDQVRFMGNASTIAAAKYLISKKQPDVLILDIQLVEDAPHASGITLLPWLRANYPKLVIIMLTNMVEPYYRNLCIVNGAHYFLDKSKEFDRIAQIITESIISKY